MQYFVFVWQISGILLISCFIKQVEIFIIEDDYDRTTKRDRRSSVGVEEVSLTRLGKK